MPRPNPNKSKVNMIANKSGKKSVCFPCGLVFNSVDELMSHEDTKHNNDAIQHKGPIKDNDNDSNS